MNFTRCYPLFKKPCVRYEGKYIQIMKKLSTLFKKNPENLGRVINEINPENEWALKFSRSTKKFDGTSCAIINGVFYSLSRS